MIKKMFAIPLLCISMVFFVQCAKDLSDPETNNSIVKKGPGSGGGGGGGGEVESATNNLSFPVLSMDGFGITPLVGGESLTVPYTGPYTGLSTEELAALEGFTWYAQKVTGNKWQADFSTRSAPTDVTFVDWGDVLESVNPKINTPTRVELTLYKDVSNDVMRGYTMALLAYPSSKDETQGTNGYTYVSGWATLVSSAPKLVIQPLGGTATDLMWDGTKWTGTGVGLPATGFGFAPELNVGGKYIFGASTGGWKPTVAGVYRITFYIPLNGSNIQLTSDTQIGNYAGNTTDGTFTIPTEGSGGKPQVDALHNLTYVDVTVGAAGGGGGGGKGGKRR